MKSPPVAVTAEHLLPSSRYRHPGDVIRLISAGLLLACSLAAPWVARRSLLGPAAGAVAAAILAEGILASTVLLYRLATYWLPVPPGWYSWRLLQRMDYV